MLISRDWLQTYFEEPLPSAEVLAEALTFHAFEIDDIEEKGADAVLDIKVTPNRGHDCLSHFGIAKELSAILKVPLKIDPFAQKPQLEPATKALSVSLESPLCRRYIAGYIRNVSVGPSPEWMVRRLEAIGQRSINNIVDATNYVMFSLGQPLHAFDARKLSEASGYAIAVRAAHSGERLVALDEKEYTLEPSMLVITDVHEDVPIGIAGIKGGKPAGIGSDTVDIILESAHFDGVSVRKSAQALKLRTDASARFEQHISPELAGYAMREVVGLISSMAGGELVGFSDIYPTPQEKQYASVTVEQVNQLLGVSYTAADVGDALQRLRLPYKEEEGAFEVAVPFERLDLTIPEDLVEEVGRILGYDRVLAQPLPEVATSVAVNPSFYMQDAVRSYLLDLGFSEVYTSVFAEKGERVVLNKVDGVRPYLRTTIAPELQAALERNSRNKELFGCTQVRLFEIGTVWKDGKESIEIALAVESVKKHKTQKEYESELAAFIAQLPTQPNAYESGCVSTTQRYLPFSKFPYIVRDVAFWCDATTSTEGMRALIKEKAGALCSSVSLFDRFEKEGSVSLAFRIIFQSFERTLTDDEANAAMEQVYLALQSRGVTIR